MKYLLIACLFFTVAASAQDKKESKSTFVYVERMPKPEFDLGEYLGNNLKYPELARNKDIEGQVIIKFIVTEKGEIDSAVIIKGIGAGCDEAALEVIKNMPHWTPGMQNGKLVRVYYTQPITFKLEGGRKKKKHKRDEE